MRLEIERGELLKALSHVTSVVERRTTIPILSNVMLKASGSTLMFKATDLEREVSESVEAKVQTTGALTVPAHMLLEQLVGLLQLLDELAAALFGVFAKHGQRAFEFAGGDLFEIHIVLFE